ncbi:MAG: hypothetical protein DRP87_15970 [Spirochaetes bacterium]|nr:MAG: hypothetical protein DRP87_15970 [Spirochaetota bacterium]
MPVEPVIQVARMVYESLRQMLFYGILKYLAGKNNNWFVNYTRFLSALFKKVKTPAKVYESAFS